MSKKWCPTCQKPMQKWGKNSTIPPRVWLSGSLTFFARSVFYRCIFSRKVGGVDKYPFISCSVHICIKFHPGNSTPGVAVW